MNQIKNNLEMKSVEYVAVTSEVASDIQQLKHRNKRDTELINTKNKNIVKLFSQGSAFQKFLDETFDHDIYFFDDERYKENAAFYEKFENGNLTAADFENGEYVICDQVGDYTFSFVFKIAD